MFTVTGHRDAAMRRSLLLKKTSSLCLCVSVAVLGGWLSVPAGAQQLINRVMARVNSEAITLTDVQAAIGLGIVQPMGADAIASGTQLMIERQLVLVEVQRFPPPEPAAAAIDREAARLKMNAGPRLAALMQSTGLSDERIHEIARDDLRVLGYLDQRFGTAVQVSDDEVTQYYRGHPQEFMRDDQPMPVDEAEPLARQRASEQRRRATIDQWIRDLRARADVTVNPVTGSKP